jgi:hypothetical protein
MEPRPDGPEYKKTRSLSLSFKVDWDGWIEKMIRRMKGDTHENIIVRDSTNPGTDRTDKGD